METTIILTLRSHCHVAFNVGRGGSRRCCMIWAGVQEITSVVDSCIQNNWKITFSNKTQLKKWNWLFYSPCAHKDSLLLMLALGRSRRHCWIWAGGWDITSVVDGTVGNNLIDEKVMVRAVSSLSWERRVRGAKIRAFLCLCRIHTRLPQVVGMDHPAVQSMMYDIDVLHITTQK